MADPPEEATVAPFTSVLRDIASRQEIAGSRQFSHVTIAGVAGTLDSSCKTGVTDHLPIHGVTLSASGQRRGFLPLSQDALPFTDREDIKLTIG